MMKVFISYRRDDSAAYARLIYDRLERRFGQEFLFMDVDDIAPGINFVDALQKEVAKCDVLLAVIGKQWLDMRDENGKRRLDDPADFVRIEITAALRRGISVIPIMVDGTHPPKPDSLPVGLKDFAYRNGLYIRHTSFNTDMITLIKAIENLADEPYGSSLSDQHAIGTRGLLDQPSDEPDIEGHDTVPSLRVTGSGSSKVIIPQAPEPVGSPALPIAHALAGASSSLFPPTPHGSTNDLRPEGENNNTISGSTYVSLTLQESPAFLGRAGSLTISGGTTVFGSITPSSYEGRAAEEDEGESLFTPIHKNLRSNLIPGEYYLDTNEDIIIFSGYGLDKSAIKDLRTGPNGTTLILSDGTEITLIGVSISQSELERILEFSGNDASIDLRKLRGNEKRPAPASGS